MSNVALITASTSCLPDEVIKQYHIRLIPFVIQFIDGNYREDGDLPLSDFYRRLSAADTIPTTAPTSVAQFMQIFGSDYGSDDTLLVFHISPKTSKSYENALQATERFPDRRIINIDTNTISIGSGLQVIAAAEALAAGASIDETVAQANRLRNQTFSAMVPASVKFLRMSGRLGRLPAIAASLIGIQPVLTLGPTGMDVLAKPRSPEAAQEALLSLSKEFLGEKKARSVGISHTNAPELAAQFLPQVQAAYPGVPIYISEAGPILAVHGGPGALGLALIRED